MSRRAMLVTVVLTLVGVSMLVSLVVTGTNVESRLVPPHLREGRWEMSMQGGEARRLTEALCGPLPDGAWLDRPDLHELPVILGASDELTACFGASALPALIKAYPFDYDNGEPR